MRAIEMLSRSGISVYWSRIQVPHFRTVGQLEHQVVRFQTLQQRTVESGPSGPHALVAHLVALDLIDPNELPTLVQWRWTMYQAKNDAVLEAISIQGDLHRTILSDESHIAVQINSTPDLGAFLEWVRALEIFPPGNARELLESIRCAQLAWAFEHLPPLIFADLSSMQPCTPLDHTAWVREVSGMTPPHSIDAVQAVLECGVGDLLDTVETTTSMKDGRSLIRQALALLTVNAKESEDQHIKRWLHGLFALAPLLQGYSPATGLSVAYMADLIESGTVVAGANSHTMTRLNYIKKTVLPLHQAMTELQGHPRSWNESQRRDLYMGVITSATVIDKPLVRAAISCFQHFLEEMFDIAIIRLHVEDQEPTRVRAQTITAIEVDRMEQWLQHDDLGDTSLQMRLRALFWLCYDAPFRISEALNLRKENLLLLSDGSYEITILPAPGIDLKSDAAARRVWIKSKIACVALNKLVEERDKEKWTSTELLFAKGLEGQMVYRKSHMRLTLLKLLKHCTGDPHMTIHALRHAWANRELSSVLCSPRVDGVNQLAFLAAQMGHQSVHTTWVRYFHLPERARRWHLDMVLKGQLTWTSNVVAHYCKQNPTTVRQRASRHGMSVQDVARRLLRERAASFDLAGPDCAGWYIPRPMKHALLPNIPVVARQVFHFLVGVARGGDPAHIAPRHGMTSKKGLEAWKHTSEVIQAMSSSSLLRNNTERTTSSAKRFSISKGLQAKYEPALSWMAERITDTHMVQLGVDAWIGMRNRYGFINLEHSNSFAFLLLLKTIGFKSQDFAMSAQVQSDAAQGDSSHRVASVQENFVQAFGARPASIRWLSPHPTRPDIYLRWHVPTKSTVDSDLSGLDALLLALKVYLKCFSEATP